MEKKNEIIKKIFQARNFVRELNLKKIGYNSYSKFYYYTPEQISDIVSKIEEEFKIIHIFELKRNEFGEYGELSVIDTETGEIQKTTQATAIPSITATNATQQIGGAVTFTNRYMLQSLYNIAENTIDPDNAGIDAKLTNAIIKADSIDELNYIYKSNIAKLKGKEKNIFIAELKKKKGGFE